VKLWQKTSAPHSPFIKGALIKQKTSSLVRIWEVLKLLWILKGKYWIHKDGQTRIFKQIKGWASLSPSVVEDAMCVMGPESQLLSLSCPMTDFA
jgi:hypothetical protein